MDWNEVHFWAKTTKDGRPGISVHDHCLNVGCVAEALIAALPDQLKPLIPGENGSAAPILAALHDLGKITPGRQTESGRVARSRAEETGARRCQRGLENEGGSVEANRVAGSRRSRPVRRATDARNDRN